MKSNNILVFGSNLAGVHGAGAARYAHRELGAEWGVGEGLTGDSYALPTKDENIVSRDLEGIEESFATLFGCMEDNSDLMFMISPVGCGLAGFQPHIILQLIEEAADKSSARNWCLTHHWVTDGYI